MHIYRRLIQLRKRSPALTRGDYQPLVEGSEVCLIYLQRSPEQICLVWLNFSDRLHTHDLPLGFANGQTLFSNWGREGEQSVPCRLALAPFEIYIAQLDVS